MAGIRQRIAGATLALAALAAGQAPQEAQAQPAAKSPATSSAALPTTMENRAQKFDGSDAHYKQLTAGMEHGDIENFRSTYNNAIFSQQSAADQAVANIFHIKDPALFSILKQSITDKMAGKPLNTVDQVSGYLDNKQTSLDKFFEQRLKSPGQKQPTSGQVDDVLAVMQKKGDVKEWNKATEGWSKDALTDLQARTKAMMADDRMYGGQAALKVSQVANPGMLALVLQAAPYRGPDDKGADRDRIQASLSSFVQNATQNMERFSADAKQALSVKAPTIHHSMPVAAPLSDKNCSREMNSAAAGTAKPSGQMVTSADIPQAAKDMTSKPKDQWPDISSWDKKSMGILKEGVRQEMANQMNVIRQAGLGILAGHNPQEMAAGIKNTEIKTLVEAGFKPGMSPEERDYMLSQAQTLHTASALEINATINKAITALPKELPMRTQVNKPDGLNC